MYNIYTYIRALNSTHRISWVLYKRTRSAGNARTCNKFERVHRVLSRFRGLGPFAGTYQQNNIIRKKFFKSFVMHDYHARWEIAPVSFLVCTFWYNCITRTGLIIMLACHTHAARRPPDRIISPHLHQSPFITILLVRICMSQWTRFRPPGRHNLHTSTPAWHADIGSMLA